MSFKTAYEGFSSPNAAHFKGFKVVSTVHRKKTKKNKRQTWTAHLTQLPCKLWRTLTHKAVQHCVTLAAVLAGFAGALVPLDLAVRASKAGGAQAAEASRTLLMMQHRVSQGSAAAAIGVRLREPPNLARGAVLALAVAAFQVCEGQEWISRSRLMERILSVLKPSYPW